MRRGYGCHFAGSTVGGEGQPQPTAGRPTFVAGTVEPGVVPGLAGSVVAVEVVCGCAPGAATPTKSRPSTTTTSAFADAVVIGTTLPTPPRNAATTLALSP